MFRAEGGNNPLYQIIFYSIRGVIRPYSFTISEEKNARFLPQRHTADHRR